MTIEVTENEDKSLTISWDKNDPQESVLNDWTEQDFLNAINIKLGLHNHSQTNSSNV